MSSAFRCDSCGKLFEKKVQIISIPRNRGTFWIVKVAEGYDLCSECVLELLRRAPKKVE